jgi:hypothetical protein
MSRLGGAGRQHGDGAADGVRAELLTSAREGDQLGEDPLGERDVTRRAREGDLVAPDVDVGVEQLLRDLQVLVAGAEQREDCLVGDVEPGLGRLGWVGCRSGGRGVTRVAPCGTGHVLSVLPSALMRQLVWSCRC